MKRGTVAADSLTAVVTGGSSGIGAEFARQLAAMGYSLLLVSNCDEQLLNIAEEIRKDWKINVRTLCLDLTTPGAAETVAEATEGMPPVEILINNAGIFSFKTMDTMSTKETSLYLDLHIRAVTELSLLFARRMAERGSGRILNMSSMSCWMPMPGIGMYSATKSYIRVFSRALHLEMLEKGVHVMVACPGGIATDLFGLPKSLQKLGVRVGALATPSKFVSKALSRLFKGRKQYVNGLLNRLAIVIVAVLPTRARLIVKHKMLDKQK